MNELKVLNVQPFDNFGSIQRRSLHVALDLRKEGIQTVFTTPRKGNAFTKTVMECGFRVYKTSCLRPVFVRNLHSLLHTIKWFKDIPKNLLEVHQIALAEQPDLIQVNGFVCVQEALIAALFHRQRFVWNLIGTLYPRLIILLFLPMIRMAALRLFVAKKIVPYYFGESDDPIINEPVDTVEFDPTRISRSEIEVLRRALSIDTQQRVIGYLGSVSPVKGLEFLIKSASFIKNQYPNVKLIIAGDFTLEQAEYRLKLERLVHELQLTKYVIFAGNIEHNKVRLLLSIFNVFVSASISEGTPVSILEAMAMEKPVIATNVGGISEQIINSESGILVPPKNQDAIAKAAIFLFENPVEAAILGKKARERVKTIYGLERCIGEYRKLYKCFEVLK